MEVESATDLAMEYTNWALETNLWNGREIDPTQVNDLKETFIENITKMLLAQNLESYKSQKMSAELAYIGATDTSREEIHNELTALQNGTVSPAGFSKSFKRFWKKYKVEILVGIAAVAVVTAVAVGVFCAAAGAAAAESKKNPPKPPANPAPPENTPTASWPETQLSLNAETVHFNGRTLDLCDAMQPNTIAQTLHSQTAWNTPSHLKELQEKTSPWQPLRNIPVFSSKNFPPVKEKLVWAYEMIDWGLSEHELGRTPQIPKPENFTSQTFRTEGNLRKDLAILGINGINTSLHESIQHAEYLAQFAQDLSVTWVHNHSNGAPVDVAECMLLNYSGISPNTESLERKEWIAFHEANQDNPEAKLLQFCHSQGAIHTKNALMSVPEEIRQRIIVVAIAPAAIIPRELCHASFNYASKKDKIYLGEILCKSMRDVDQGQQAAKDFNQLILLEPHKDATGIDHEFESLTFLPMILNHFGKYLNGIK